MYPGRSGSFVIVTYFHKWKKWTFFFFVILQRQQQKWLINFWVNCIFFREIMMQETILPFTSKPISTKLPKSHFSLLSRVEWSGSFLHAAPDSVTDLSSILNSVPEIQVAVRVSLVVVRVGVCRNPVVQKRSICSSASNSMRFVPAVVVTNSLVLWWK